MIDFRKFYTDFKSISLEFLAFKEAYPLRMEAISFINLIIKNKNSVTGNRLVFDEMHNSMKKSNLFNHELTIIKNCIKGPKVHSVFIFITSVLVSNNFELIQIIVNTFIKLESK